MNARERDYRDWLINQLNDRKKDYRKLLMVLYDIEFYAIINYDEDRGKDGLALREEWAEGKRGKVSLDFGVANVLEVLVGIAKRLEFRLFGSRYYDEWDYVNIFWLLIDNLGLGDAFGDISCDTFDEIHENVTHFLNREYFCHKKCNIFEFEIPPRNLKKLNIWSQMAMYVREKWPN